MPESFEHERRWPRYVAHFEIHVAYAGRNLLTLTREISRSGFFFFADPAPEIGERVRAMLYPELHEPFGVDSKVRYTLPGVGAGVDISEADREEAERFRRFVDEQATTALAWRTIGGFVRSAEDGDTSADVEFEQKEMIDVGESGEAFRVFFERYPQVAPESTALTKNAEALAQAKQLLQGVSSEPVGIKLHAKDRLRRAHLGLLAKGTGFVAIVPPPQGSTPYSFYALSGREQLLIKEGDRAVFPFFTSADLARINRDVAAPIDSGLRKVPERPTLTSAASLSSTLANWTRFDAMSARILTDLFDVLHAETRVYTVGGIQRRVRLLRNLTVLVRAREGEAEKATLMYDGKRLCALFGLEARDQQMRIRPLDEDDEVRLPAW